MRPFDLDVNHEQNGKPGLKARVTRIQSAGAQVRLELVTENGETMHVEMPHSRFREKTVSLNDQVFVTLLNARIFLEEDNGNTEERWANAGT